MEIAIHELTSLLNRAAENGANRVLEKIGYKQKELVSQREAYKLFGEAKVKRWVLHNQIVGVCYGAGKNSKIRFSRTDLENLKTIDFMGLAD